MRPVELSWLLSDAALVSRQFVDMSRIRIEGLLAAFPKLVGSGKQHTYVENGECEICLPANGGGQPAMITKCDRM